MQLLGKYVVSLTTAAILCGILLSLLKDDSLRKLLRLVCGIFLILAVLEPLTEISSSDFSWQYSAYVSEGRAAAAVGEELAADARNRIIKEELHSYILDKAVSTGAEIEAELTLDENGVPVFVHISGKWTPESKSDISRFLSEELGIAKENQQWTG